LEGEKREDCERKKSLKMMMSSLLNGSKQSEQKFSIANLLGKKIEAKEETKEENVTTAHGKN